MIWNGYAVYCKLGEGNVIILSPNGLKSRYFDHDAVQAALSLLSVANADRLNTCRFNSWHAARII